MYRPTFNRRMESLFFFFLRHWPILWAGSLMSSHTPLQVTCPINCYINVCNMYKTSAAREKFIIIMIISLMFPHSLAYMEASLMQI